MTMHHQIAVGLLGMVLPAAAMSGTGSFRAVTGLAGSGTLIAVTARGDTTWLADLGAPVLSLAFNGTDGQLYGTLSRREQGVSVPYLITVDLETGEASILGALSDADGVPHQIAGIAFTEDGRLFGISRRAPSSLVEIEPASGLLWRVGGGLGVDVRNVGAAMHEGTFYFMSGDPQHEVELFTVDLEGGAALRIGPTGVVQGGLGLASDGEGLFAVMWDTFYQVDPTTAVATPVRVTEYAALSSLEYVDDLKVACPCDGGWANHGAYVSCVAQFVRDLEPGLAREAVSEAARSTCGP